MAKIDRFVSPNEVHKAACEQMLDGREPTTKEDWMLCANFWARNIANGLEESATLLMAAIFDCPLSNDTLKKIAQFQAEHKPPKE